MDGSKRTTFLGLTGLLLATVGAMTGEPALAQGPCEGTMVEVELWVTPEGNVLTEHHDTAVVFPGDCIRWVRRPSGSGPEIEILGFRRIANLELLAHGGGDGPGASASSPAIGGGLSADRVENGMRVSPDARGATVRAPDLSASFDNESFRAAVFAVPARAILFERDSEGALWTGGQLGPEGALLSPPVAANRGHWLWAYEWRVFKPSGNIEEVDPHIFMHERRNY